MSSSSSTMATVTLLLATATLLSTTAATGGGMARNWDDAREDGWQLSMAAHRAFGPAATTVATLYDVPSRSFGNGYTVYTSAGEFDMKRASLRLAFDPARVRADLHGGCTYRFTHHGPRAHFKSSGRVIYPNVIAARHIPTADCPTNDGPSAEWARRDAERSLGRFCHLNRMTSAECDALRQRR